MSDGPIIVSSCLLGIKCRHDGTDAYDKEVAESGDEHVPVCPEELGGLGTPRKTAEIKGGDGWEVVLGATTVVDSYGTDITEKFIKGGETVLKMARMTGAKRAILKEGSPSCGVKFIKQDGVDRPGPGVTAAMLEGEGIKTEGR